MIIEPDDAAEFEQLELLEQLRGRYQSEAPAPDVFSQPSFLPTDQSADDGGAGMQATPFPGMVTDSPNGGPRPRRTRPVAPQRDDP